MSFKNYRLFSYLDLKLSSTVLSKYLFFISQSNNRNLFSKLNESLIISQFKHHNQMALPHVKFADEQTKQEGKEEKHSTKVELILFLLLNCELAFL